MIGDAELPGLLERGIAEMLSDVRIQSSIHPSHLRDTPRRVMAAFKEYFSGLDQDPKDILKAEFVEEQYDEMILVLNIEFTSICAHHLVPMWGYAHFGYLPQGRIVGLSKIPRLVDAFARRPQVQERLSVQIVDSFMELVQPRGCGIVIDALHMCMAARGVRKARAFTRTTALRGIFRAEPTVKLEFLTHVGQQGRVSL